MHWKRLRKPRFLFVYPVVVGLFLFAQVSERSFRTGVALVVVGEFVRLWANGYVGHVKVNWTQKQRGDSKIGRLITGGPYALVRHPLYLGTMLVGAGFCLMVRSAWVSLAALIGFVSTYSRKMVQEEALLHEEYPQEYARYHAAVPQLLPRWFRYPNGHGRWTWQGVAASKEWKSVLWICVLTILVYFWEESVQEHKWLFDERPLYRWFLVSVAVLLIVADGLAELIMRYRQSRDSCFDS